MSGIISILPRPCLWPVSSSETTTERETSLANILARAAAIDIVKTLPVAYANGDDIQARETMANASMVAGLAFTNVSLGIVHSIAQTIGGFFPISHGLIDAILLPYVIDYNSADPTAKAVYDSVAKDMGGTNMADIVRELNKKLGIPARVKDAIPDEAAFMANLDEMAKVSLADGCTKTNPIIPTVPQFAELIKKAYLG